MNQVLLMVALLLSLVSAGSFFWCQKHFRREPTPARKWSVLDSVLSLLLGVGLVLFFVGFWSVTLLLLGFIMLEIACIIYCLAIRKRSIQNTEHSSASSSAQDTQ